ncbi:MAG: TetR/AcrR family transcriptional regulator, partial [Pseudomonadota bacterium]
ESELSETGVEKLSLRGVAKRAGVSHAAPAHHFKDKAGLLTALTVIGFERLTEAQLTRAAEITEPRKALIAKGKGYITFALANPALFDLMFGSHQPDFTDVMLGRAADEAMIPLMESVTEMAGSSPFAGGQPTADLVASWALVHGLAGLLNHGKLRWAEDLNGDIDSLVHNVLSARLNIS